MEALWRGYVRAVPVGAAGALGLWVGITVGLFVPVTDACCGFKAPEWWVFSVLASLFVPLALAGSIILFNRPRKLVPPHARKDSGALSEWLARRKE